MNHKYKVEKPPSDTPFGRQRQPVHVMLTGEPEDVEHYRDVLIRMFEHQPDEATKSFACNGLFTIYPRAVND